MIKEINLERLNFNLIIALISVLYLFSLLYLLGYAPLHQEETRRALIALEMHYNQNIWQPTIIQEIFYDHPPLWNWILLGSFKIFGLGNVFGLRFFNVMSLFLMGVQIYFICKKYINKEFALLSALMFVTSIDIYFYFATNCEIDIFYSLIIFSIFNSIYYFYNQKKIALMYFFVYILGSIGFLTKGYVTIIFIGISLISYILIFKKDYKTFFSLYHFIFGFLMIGIIALFFIQFSKYGDSIAYLEGMWKITFEKASGDFSALDYIIHLFQFPLFFIQVSLVPSIFILYLVYKNNRKLFAQNQYILFGLIIFISNIIIYWISPDSKSRYMYMLIPLFTNFTVYLYFKNQNFKNKLNTFFEYLFFGIMFVVLIACFVYPFLPFFIDKIYTSPYFIVVSIFCFLLSLFLVLIFKSQNSYFKSIIFVLFIIIARIMYSEISLTQRHFNPNSFSNKASKISKEILIATNYNTINIYKSASLVGPNPKDIESASTYYLTSYNKKLLNRKNNFNDKGYYVVDSMVINEIPKNGEVIKKIITPSDNINYLVKVN